MILMSSPLLIISSIIAGISAGFFHGMFFLMSYSLKIAHFHYSSLFTRVLYSPATRITLITLVYGGAIFLFSLIPLIFVLSASVMYWAVILHSVKGRK
jgi:hypothetical protein